MPNAIEQIKAVLRRYYEADPWTGERSSTYDESLSATGTIDAIVEIIREEEEKLPCITAVKNKVLSPVDGGRHLKGKI